MVAACLAHFYKVYSLHIMSSFFHEFFGEVSLKRYKYNTEINVIDDDDNLN